MESEIEAWLEEVEGRRKAKRDADQDLRTGIAQEIRWEIERLGIYETAHGPPGDLQERGLIVEGLRRALQFVVGTRK